MNSSLTLDKLGTAGLLITAVAAPCCFPLFGFVLAALGFGSVEILGGWTEYIFQGLVIITLIGSIINYRHHRNGLPLIIAGISSTLIIYSYNYYFDISMIYSGMFGLFSSAGLNYYFSRKNKIDCATCTAIEGKTVELNSIITCPNCGHKKEETMPTDTCQFFYECENCKNTFRPKQGDCCVYCSYGTTKCPSKQ